ncbi:MAG: carbon-nitrogen hydrolase family protein [Acidobacteriota bacterium]
MARERSIAAAQTVPVRGDVAANTDAHLRLAHLAADEGAAVLVFPELSLTGYEMDLAEPLAFVPGDPRLAPLVAAAAARGLTLVVGAPVRIDDRLHIGALILAPDGTVAVYTKQRLGAFGAGAAVDGTVPPGEATVFAPGRLDPLLRISGHPMAIGICADTGRPAHPQAAADRGATTYLASVFVIPSEFDREAANMAVYAARHRMAVVFANYGGPSGGLASAGRSAIWSETGERLVELDRSGAGIAVAVHTGAGWRARAIMLGGGQPAPPEPRRHAP